MSAWELGQEGPRQFDAGSVPEGLVYWRYRDMAVDHDHCFLCGSLLSADTRTEEHVFPRWLQRRFNLWDERLTLMNRTTIRYRGLTIPCCRSCNTQWLSRVETEVSAAFESGYAAVRKLDPTLLCLWMWKLYYGIHFKEVALPVERRDEASRPIVSADYLGRFAEIHHVLQALRNTVRFRYVPGSLFVYEAQVPDRPEHQFDYRDAPLRPFLAVRAADTVVIAAFDWEAMANLVHAPRLEAAAALPLHPFQFTELAAFSAYVAAKFTRRFGYLVRPEGDHDFVEPVIFVSDEHPADAPSFTPIDTEEWGRWFAASLGRDLAEVYRPEDDATWTTLLRADGSPNFMPLDRFPYGSDIRSGWA
jgi:hypothetical protein